MSVQFVSCDSIHRVNFNRMSSTEAKIETEAVEAVEVKSTEEPAKTDDQVLPQCLLQTLQTFSISNPFNTRF